MTNPWLAKRQNEYSFVVTTGKPITGRNAAEGAIKTFKVAPNGLIFYGVQKELQDWFCVNKSGNAWSGTLTLSRKGAVIDSVAIFFEIASVDLKADAIGLRVDPMVISMITRSKFFN
jgi:hypothetical protein